MRQLPSTLLLLLALLSGNVHAQDAPFFRHITEADGLNGSSVISLAVDQKGFVWIGTANGLTRHDGARMKAFHHVPGDSTSLPNARVDIIKVTLDGSIYVGTQDGAARFDEATQSFWRLPIDDEERVVVHDFDELPSGELLLSTWQHGAFVFDPATDTARAASFHFGDRPEDKTVRNIALADADHIWLARYRGLYHIDLGTGAVEMPDWPAATMKWLSEAAIFKLMQHDGVLWMATTEGLWSVRTDSGELIHHVIPDIEDPYARSMFVDSKGDLWAGMNGKLAKLDRSTGQFRTFEPVAGLESSVFPGTVHAIAEDHSGVLWIGSDEQGLSLLDLYRVPPTHLESRLNPAYALPEGHFWSAAEDANGPIWLGSERSLGRWDRKTGRYEPFPASGLENTTVSALLVDDQDRIWVGTTGSGVCELIVTRRECRPVVPEVSTVYVMYPDGPDELWIGSFGGLLHLNTRTGARKWYRHDPLDERTLDSGLVLDIQQDDAGRLWVGTESGLNRLDPVGDRFVRVLANSPVFNIEARPDGRFWLAGLDISIFDVNSGQQQKLDAALTDLTDGMSKTVQMDAAGRLWVSFATSTAVLGLNGREEGRFENPFGRRSFEFPVSARLRTRDGTIVFGLADAILALDPEDLVVNPFPPAPVFSGTVIDGAFLPINDSSDVTLTPENRVITAVFSAPHFGDHPRTRYEVRLTDFETDWRPVEAPEVSFTHLPPGTYELEVRATTSNGLSGISERPLHITVLAPWWTAWWFILLIAGSGVGLVLATFRWRMGDLRRQNARLDNEVNRRTQELLQQATELEVANQTKSRFFSNVSHELRTPLTLIKGYLEEVQTAGEANEMGPVNRRRITRARGLTDRLDDLVGQLLDLARSDNQRLELNRIPADLSSFVARVVSHFQIAAHRKFIDLTFEADPGALIVSMDAVKMDQVVANLVGNAIKFTPNGGSVFVSVRGDNNTVTLTVADTGPGIPREEQKRIFERFYQVDNALTRAHEGLGIGLALTSDLVQMHDGAIEVQSVSGEGSVFTVRLDRIHAESGSVFFAREADSAHEEDTLLHPLTADPAGRPRLLLVEDNPELRRHMREILVDLFEVIEATDGADGWQKVQLRSPDLVLTDVMMPGMSGIQLLQEIRASDRFKELPVVLLTARSDPDAQVEGLEARADDFIAKPFNRRVLRARLLNLADRQEEWSTATAPIKNGLQKDQAEFLDRARAFIRSHLTETIAVADLAEATHTSERTFQRYIKDIAGVTAGAFVRTERLEVARTLLERGDVRSVSHAAQETGFGNVSHFSKVFEEQFGINPRTYLE